MQPEGYVFRRSSLREDETAPNPQLVGRGPPRLASSAGGTHVERVPQVMEGVYSMEGSVAALRAAAALRRRLGLQLYLDEAHSVGATGARGRGVTELRGVAPSDVDVLMGTFTKSFCSSGGYIAGSARLVRWLRAHGHAHAYAHAMAPPAAQQVLATLRELRRPSGQERVAALRENTRYFRER